MEEKPSYYAIIPAEVRYDTKLKDKAKLLYGEITALSDLYGYCFASNKYFAELYNVDPTYISKLIKELIDRGYIKSIVGNKRGVAQKCNRYLTIVQGGVAQKCKYNNTSININNNNIKGKETIADYDWINEEEKNEI